MYLVAIVRLADNPDALDATLAAELAVTLYELRLTLAAGLPAVVLLSADEVSATRASAALEKRGHHPVVCCRRDVVMSAQMVALRDFQLGPDALAAAADAKETLPYQSILALLRATHRTAKTSTTQVKERKFRPAMAIATGGLIMSKTTKREVISQSIHHEQVLYIYPRDGTRPWILRERSARYAGLGAQLGPVSAENFAMTTQRLRMLAPQAMYDERLLHSRPIRGLADGIEATDIFAHLLALEAAQRR
jgi:hypothetical protein